MPVQMDRLIADFGAQAGGDNTPKRGDDIFLGEDYPRTWEGFVGQDEAKEQLMVSSESSVARAVRGEHTLIESGIHGVGKTTLAHILAYTSEVGLLVTSGPLTVNEFRELVTVCEDRDIIFIDEAHLLVQRARNAADWLLPFMLSGKLVTSRGSETVPDVQIVAATTEAGKLPETLTSRFMVTPTIVHYTVDEATQIASQLSDRMGVPLPLPEHSAAVAIAADHNPRLMRKILTAIRDLGHSRRYAETHPNLEKAYAYAGVSADGLGMVARDILLVLMQAPQVTASIETIQAQLGEPGPLKHYEKQLLQRGLMTIASGKGRMLTEQGARRAHAEAQTRINKEIA